MNDDRRGFEFYLSEGQFKRKLPSAYFLFSKEGMLWLVVVYIAHSFLSFLFFLLVAVFSFLYIVKNKYQYHFYNKEDLALFKGLKRILKGDGS